MDTKETNEIVSPTNLLIRKYKNRLANMVVMDDYDGGQAAMLNEIIGDLEMTDRGEKLLVDLGK
jgi:tRNA A37 threonylcarbamoyladenosine biosynthesis protein TsaE